MALSIGKVAKLFGLSVETLRYYEQAGFLSPKKNPENGYREYDFEDLFLLTDLLFYRDIGIPIRDIQAIFNGMGINEVSGLISDKKRSIRAKMDRLSRSLTKLENWEQLHSESLEFMGKYDLRPMPIALRQKTSYDDYPRMLAAFQKDLQADRDLAFFLTFSFFTDFRESDIPQLHRYIALDKSVAQNLSFDFLSSGLIEESASSCLFTVVKFQPDVQTMLAPLLEYAQKNRIALTGEIYGRQSINYYGGLACEEYYRVYAVMHRD